MKYEDKVVVVTGAGGGVGRELVHQLLKKGASVAAVDINKDALTETKMSVGEFSGKVSIHIADITDQNRVSKLPAEVIECHGHVDGIINNAGIIQPFITFAELEEASCQRLMNINFYGMWNMSRAFIPYLASSDEAFIGNVSSMGGFLPVPGQAIYGASKAAVKIATEGLRMELSKTNIQVNLIIPGGIDTDIKKNSGLGSDGGGTSEEDRKGAGVSITSPADAADIMLTGIAKNKAKILIGKDAKMMDFLYRLMPIKAGAMICKVMEANHGGVINEAEKLKAAV